MAENFLILCTFQFSTSTTRTENIKLATFLTNSDFYINKSQLNKIAKSFIVQQIQIYWYKFISHTKFL